jgi:N6-L-threonylcarbamoyladenine synthase
VMGLPYPGGPQIDALAKSGDTTAIHFPRALTMQNSYEFSFSGLKSAVLNYLNQAAQQGNSVNQADVAASFQAAVVDVLVAKTLMAAKQCGVDKVTVSGGVAANSYLHAVLAQQAAAAGFGVFFPPSVLCTDNAAMIACRAYYKYRSGLYADLHLNAVPNLKLG